jgi:hypothetical protein
MKNSERMISSPMQFIELMFTKEECMKHGWSGAVLVAVSNLSETEFNDNQIDSATKDYIKSRFPELAKEMRRLGVDGSGSWGLYDDLIAKENNLNNKQ